ncbi:putative signal-transduction protein [Candidatus Methanoperedens nitroreducens]|uniref:Putative signal-transduction protein n=1 Tax=Candidatus Methanoperedens nitratireducens TaxID=1392998 RepID=A0A062V297_9EURY|nr:CBS domain-containing protein [Candidatus Methanoperedens nitroreducens]KCZ73241.1 putative signal-transduction protein [Candidatus Methanoperedens nitroreducens]MDJ1422813.1 CBS domain-containing protein [Candidatus Methanoperedens sp.]
MKVSEIMTKNPITVDPEASAMDVARKMQEEKVGTVLVADRDHLEGIVIDRQIATKVVAAGKDPARTKVSEFMTRDPVTASPDMQLEDVSRMIGENKCRRIPIVESGRLMGIVSSADIAAHARECDVCINNILDEVAKAEK